MKNLFGKVFLFSITLVIASGCSKKPIDKFSFAFYNVENLFDTIDDPAINDSSFLPGSMVAWNTERYQHKLHSLALVISSIDSLNFPAVFGLGEVENQDVLVDLVNNPLIINAGYKILHQDSPDERGIDVALLYDPKKYNPIETHFLALNFPFDLNNKTRDILYSKGLVNKKDTLHIFVNHWVSRWGGQEKTEAFRQFTGKFLKRVTDSIFAFYPDANILIAGDLNDNPTDKSLTEFLAAKKPEMPFPEKTLFNLSLRQFEEGNGTLYYKSWDMFDQIIVSSALLNGSNGLKTNSTDQSIMKKNWLLFQPKEGPARPSRTASGNKYFGGFSDHLPVFLELEVLK